MDETTKIIEAKLDRLAEFQAEVDVLTMKRQELIDAVKIPAEVQAIHNEGVKRKAELDAAYKNRLMILDEEKRALLETVVIPPEIRAAYEAVEAKRREIERQIEDKKREAYFDTTKRQSQVDDEFSSKVRDVYEQVAARKEEITVEFAGKVDAASDNIAKLTAEIKADVVQAGQSIKGAVFHAVYVKGRVTWNTDMLDGMVVAFPALAKARKEGQPSVTLRKI